MAKSTFGRTLSSPGPRPRRTGALVLVSSPCAILPWTLDEGRGVFEAHLWEVMMFSWMSAGASGSWLPTRGGARSQPPGVWEGDSTQAYGGENPCFLSLHYITLSQLLHTSNNMQTLGGPRLLEAAVERECEHPFQPRHLRRRAEDICGRDLGAAVIAATRAQVTPEDPGLTFWSGRVTLASSPWRPASRVLWARSREWRAAPWEPGG